MAGLAIAALVGGILLAWFGRRSAAALVVGIALIIMGGIGTFA